MRSYGKSVTGASPSVKAPAVTAAGVASPMLSFRAMQPSRLSVALIGGLVASLVGGVVLSYALAPIGTVVFAVALAWGLVFGFAATLLRAEASFGAALVLGIVLGLAGDILDAALVPPSVPPARSFLGHVAFGTAFVLAPLVVRVVQARWSRSRRVV